jgi:hypothetical protein
MRFAKLSDFKGGWVIGDFEPTMLKTDQFEVAVLHHTAGKQIEKHYQVIATEYNVMISGKMNVNGTIVTSGDVFTYEPMEITEVEVLEDTVVICVKTPSIPNDKVVID